MADKNIILHAQNIIHDEKYKTLKARENLFIYFLFYYVGQTGNGAECTNVTNLNCFDYDLNIL